jgi:hypothetical protein
MGGELFPARYLAELTARWNPIFSRADPLASGTGIMRIRLPRWQSPFTPVPPLIGHSGSFGTVLYHAPDRDLYLAGAESNTVDRMCR